VAPAILSHYFRCTLGDDWPAAGAPLGAKIDKVIGGFDHIQVVLDNDHRIPVIHQTMEHIQELLDIDEVQARGRLVDDLKGASRSHLAELARQFDPLGLAAR
jgi:hypothetical protein